MNTTGNASEPAAGDMAEARRLLALVHTQGCRFVLSAIVKGGLIPRYVHDTGGVERVVSELVDVQEREHGFGVYYSLGEYAKPPGVRGAEHEVARVRCCWADVDAKSNGRFAPELKAATLERLRAFAPTPSIIVDTGGGYQPLWLLHEPVEVGPFPKGKPTAEALLVRAINAALARELGGDHTIDLARVFRLPGTLNTKCNDPEKYPGYTEPLPCRIVEVHPDRRYTLDDLEASVTEADRATARKEIAAKKEPAATPMKNTAIDLDDVALIEKAKAAKNGAKFTALWSGDTSGYDGDESRADLALCSALAFWTRKDAVRMDRLFRASGLCRPKWTEREDYRSRTIQAAIDGTTETYTPGRNGDPARQRGPEYSVAVKDETTAGNVAVVWTPAPRISEIAEAVAPRFPGEAVTLAPAPLQNVLFVWDGKTEAPQQFILIAAATYAGAVMGRTVGTRYANGSWLHPLFFSGLVAPTGLVKTTAERIAALSVIGKDEDAVGLGVVLHSGMMGSGVALAEALSEAEGRPLLWRIPELNTLMRHAARDGAGDLASTISALYDGRRYTHKRASKRGIPDVIDIYNPTVAIIATGQERGVRTYLDSEMVGVGVVNRFLFACAVPGDVEPVPFPEDVAADEKALDSVRQGFSDVVVTWLGRAGGGTLEGTRPTVPVGIPLDDAARAWWKSYYLRHKMRVADNDTAADLTIREPEHVRKLALLRAALEKRTTITHDDLIWGHAIASYSSACAIFCCEGAGGGESQRDKRADLFAKELHKAQGKAVRISAYMRRKAKSIGDPEELRRIIDNGEQVGLWKMGNVREGARGPTALAAWCICPACAREAEGGGNGAR